MRLRSESSQTYIVSRNWKGQGGDLIHSGFLDKSILLLLVVKAFQGLHTHEPSKDSGPSMHAMLFLFGLALMVTLFLRIEWWLHLLLPTTIPRDLQH